MFVDHAVVLEISFPAARAGLARLAGAGRLDDASDQAYSDGLAGLIRVGPLGDTAGAGKLVRVLMLDPVEHAGSFTLPLRWEATGVMGRLFPVLDANLTVTELDTKTTRLALAGAYRPPLSALGASLDRVLLHKVADATVRSLVRRVTAAIGAPAAGLAPGAERAAAPGPAPDGEWAIWPGPGLEAAAEPEIPG